ncbi:MAG: radical SAM protein [Candidatus Bathyarchaeota archaeon]|nr:radical SAM protein [Candidatus Bathyarchaeota archaeon]
MSGKVVLTADHTLMSDYRHNEFLGFGACAPPNFIPNWLYRWLFFPPIKAENGKPAAAPYGLRKIEAQLLSEGFNVVTVSPQHLRKYLDEARVLGIHVMDPFGLGPASSTFASILKKEPFLAQYFRALMENPDMQKAKKQGMKIIVGGPGSWQLQYRLNFVKHYGIDCVIMGEAENVIGKIVRSAMRNEELPKFYEVPVADAPAVDEIPDIVNPSVNGLIEIGRGCCRGCQFCSVTLRPLRWYPYEKIAREMKLNIEKGRAECMCLHAEDVMLYGSKNTIPNEDKLLRLHEMVAKQSNSIAWSHCSLAAVAAKPKLFAQISEIVRQKQAWWGAEIGIETGSAELAKKVMPAKAHPFKAEDWPEVVKTGMGLMHDYRLIPAATIIVGAPEETEDDVIRTIELIEDLKDCRSLIVPLYFVPMGRLKDEDWFKHAELTGAHRELLVKCAEHDFRWVNDLIESTFAGKLYSNVLRSFYKFFARLARYKIRQAGIPLEA